MLESGIYRYELGFAPAESGGGKVCPQPDPTDLHLMTLVRGRLSSG